MSTPRPRVAYYAFGGGLGHATRAAAILRQLRRLGDAELLVFTNAPNPLPLDHESIPYRHFPDTAPEALRQQVPQAVRDFAPDLLAVDVFAAGIVGELSELIHILPFRKALIYRLQQEAYLQALPEWLPFYDAVLLAEPPTAPISGGIDCTPILLRDADELLPRAEARQLLGADTAPVILAASTDTAWSEDFFPLVEKIIRRLQPTAQLKFADPGTTAGDPRRIRHYPLFELFNGIDVVIGAAGYNLFHEVRASGAAGIFIPRLRRFDDQYRRAQEAAAAQNPEELEHLLQQALAHCQTRPEARFQNGAIVAAKSLAGLIGIDRS